MTRLWIVFVCSCLLVLLPLTWALTCSPLTPTSVACDLSTLPSLPSNTPLVISADPSSSSSSSISSLTASPFTLVSLATSSLSTPLVLSPLHSSSTYDIAVTSINDEDVFALEATTSVTLPSATPSVVSFFAFSSSVVNNPSVCYENCTFYLTFGQAVSAGSVSNIQFTGLTAVSISAVAATADSSTLSFIVAKFVAQGSENGATIGSSLLSFTYDSHTINTPPLTGYFGVMMGSTYDFAFSGEFGNALTSTVPSSFVVRSIGQTLNLSMVTYSTTNNQINSLQVSLEAFTDITGFSLMASGRTGNPLVFTGLTTAELSGLISNILVLAPPDFDFLITVVYEVGVDGNFQQQAAYICIDYTTVNHPSVISAPSTLVVTYASAFPLIGLFSIQDLDYNFAVSPNLLMSVAVSPSISLSFSKPITSSLCVPSCSASSQSYLVEDTLDGLTTFLNNLILVQTFPQVLPEDMSLTISVDDRSNGGLPPQNYITVITIPIISQCQTQAYVQKLSNVVLSPSLNSLEITLSDSVQSALVIQPSVDCANYFDSATMSVLNHAICHFSTPRLFVVVFGYDTTWKMSQTLGILSAGFPICDAKATATGNAPFYDPLSVAFPSQYTTPSMSIIAPEYLTLCTSCSKDYISFVAVTLTNLALMPQIQWSLPSSLKNLSDVQGLNQPLLQIPLSSFPSKAAYNISFSISYLGVNYPGAWQVVTVSPATLVSLRPENPVVTNMLTSQPLSLGVEVFFASSASVSETQTPISFTWTVSPSLALESIAAGIQSANFYIQPNSLSIGTYYFTLTCTMDGSASVTQQFNVQVAGDDIYAVINGGDMHGLPVTSSLTLDGSLSYDAVSSSSSSFTYSWSCADLYGNPCLNRVQGGILDVTVTTSSITLPAGTLFPGTYLFTLVFASGNRHSSAQSHVVVYSSFSTEVFVSTVYIPPIVLSAESIVQQVNSNTATVLNSAVGGRIINAGAQLVLYGSYVGLVTNVTIGNVSTVLLVNGTLYSWSITGGPQPLNLTGLVGMNAPQLIVNALNNEQFFTPGYNYTFALTVTQILEGQVVSTGTSSDTFYINRPPVVDSFVVTSSSQTSTSFDAVNSPFSYSFHAYDPDESRALSLTSFQIYRVVSSSSFIVDLTTEMNLPYGNLGALITGDPNNNFQLTLGVRAWDRYRASSLTPYEVSAPPPSNNFNYTQLLSYYISLDLTSRNDALRIMTAASNLMSTLASSYMETIAFNSQLPTYRMFRNAYVSQKKFLVLRVLESSFASSVRAAVLTDFMSVAMADYTTLDAPTVSLILTTLNNLMIASDQELWTDVEGDPDVLQSIVYVLQQSYHASAYALAGLISSPVPASMPGLSPTPALASVQSNFTAIQLLDQTQSSAQTMLDKLRSLVQLPGDVVGLSYGRSLSGIVQNVTPLANSNTNVTFPTTSWNSTVSIAPTAFPQLSKTETLDVTVLQIDGWGDKVSFDIFPTIYVDIRISDASTSFATYPTDTVSITIAYADQACDDGYVNNGRFRFQQLSNFSTTKLCLLECGTWDPSSQQFVAMPSSALLDWDYVNNFITCAITGPGFYTALKQNMNASFVNSNDNAVSWMSMNLVNSAYDYSSPSFPSLLLADIAYIIDTPPSRVVLYSTAPSGVQNGMTVLGVTFAILGSQLGSPEAAANLCQMYLELPILGDSHTYVTQDRDPNSMRVYTDSTFSITQPSCYQSVALGMSRNEIIAISVVVGFFGTLILSVLLFFCCRTMKYWYDRHDFFPTNDSEDDAAVEIGAYNGVTSKDELAEQQRRRRGTRVSWYNKEEVEDASQYDFSRMSQGRSSSIDSKGRPSFRISGGDFDGMEVDDIEFTGDDSLDVDPSELAEIAVVLDDQAAANASSNDVVLLDGKKVRKVKQLVTMDAGAASVSNVDDSEFGSRSRASSFGSRSRNSSFGSMQEYSQSQEDELSVNSRNSRNSSIVSGLIFDDEDPESTNIQPGVPRRISNVVPTKPSFYAKR